MDHIAQLMIEAGPEKGREVSVPMGGSVRLGRATTNDVALNDPSVSRFHCRVHFKTESELWVSDLGSANQTTVNGELVQERKLAIGDRIAIGDTVIAVTSLPQAPVAVPAPRIVPSQVTPQATNATPAVDLGLRQPERSKAQSGKQTKVLRLAVVGVMVLAIVGVGGVLMLKKPGAAKPGPAPKQAAPPVDLSGMQLRYEKVDGSISNIFRFYLSVVDGKATVQVDDLADSRHFSKPLTEVKKEVLSGVAEAILKSGFFETDAEYSSRSVNRHELRDMAVTIGNKTHRARVLNTVPPPAFETARRAVEEFGLNEFGIRALSRPREELIKMADESYVLARKLYDEKNVRFENLFLAVKAIKEAQIYLETVDPKPDFFNDAASLCATYEAEQQTRYEELKFQADRATKLKDWEQAAAVLRQICATIPDRGHPWYKQAETQLLDVQRHIEK